MEKATFGPVQMLVVGFDNPDFQGEILDELRTLRDLDFIRLVDAQFIWKDEEGTIVRMELSDLGTEEKMFLGALAGGLIGLGAAGPEGAVEGAAIGAEAAIEHNFGLSSQEVDQIAKDIPNNSAAALALIEHRWAIDFRDALRNAGGSILASGLITPELLVSKGIALGALVEAVEELEEEQREITE